MLPVRHSIFNQYELERGSMAVSKLPLQGSMVRPGQGRNFSWSVRSLSRN